MFYVKKYPPTASQTTPTALFSNPHSTLFSNNPHSTLLSNSPHNTLFSIPTAPFSPAIHSVSVMASCYDMSVKKLLLPLALILRSLSGDN
jgi:hypothetical protein